MGQELPGGLFSGLLGKAQHFRFGFMVEVIACPRVQLGPGVQGSRYMKNGWECQRPSLHQTPRRHHSALSARVPGWQCSALSPGRAEGVWGRVLGPWNHRGCRLWEVTQRNPGAQRQLPSPVSCPSPVAPPSDSPWSSSPQGWCRREVQMAAGRRTAWRRGHGTDAKWEILHRCRKRAACGRASKRCGLPAVTWLRHIAGEPGTAFRTHPSGRLSFSSRAHRVT